MNPLSLIYKDHDKYAPFTRYSVNQSPVEWMRHFFSLFDSQYRDSNWAVGLDSGNYFVIGSSELILLLQPSYPEGGGMVQLEEYSVSLPKWWQQI